MSNGRPAQRQAYMATTPCRFFQNGNCLRGASCYFMHDTPAVDSAASSSKPPYQTIEAPHSDTSSSFASGQSAPVASTSTSGSPPACGDVAVCSICIEAPTEYGLLEQCAHVFCLQCIRAWRNPRDKSESQIESGVLYQCPNCRKHSSFVIPSKVYYPEGDEKQRAEATYKAVLSHKPCKWLAERSSNGNRWCPFGSSCFYKHVDPDTQEPINFTHTHEDTLERQRRSRDRRRNFELDRSEFAIRSLYTYMRNRSSRMGWSDLENALSASELEVVMGDGEETPFDADYTDEDEDLDASEDGWGDTDDEEEEEEYMADIDEAIARSVRDYNNGPSNGLPPRSAPTSNVEATTARSGATNWDYLINHTEEGRQTALNRMRSNGHRLIQESVGLGPLNRRQRRDFLNSQIRDASRQPETRQYLTFSNPQPPRTRTRSEQEQDDRYADMPDLEEISSSDG